MRDESDKQTKKALTAVIRECLHNPNKKNEFIQEGTIDVLLGESFLKALCSLVFYFVLVGSNDEGLHLRFPPVFKSVNEL
jgi:hypothetical protein